MKVAEFRAVLSHLQQICAAAGAKGPAKDFQIIADVLRPHGDAHLSNFVTELSGRLSLGKEKPKALRKSAGSARAVALNENVITPHVTRLREAGTEQNRFGEAFERLRADPSLNLADLGEIARRYSNSVTKYRSLSAAHKDIAQAFVRRARFENKLR